MGGSIDRWSNYMNKEKNDFRTKLKKMFQFNPNESYFKLFGKADDIRDIIKSLPENEIIENKKKELLSFAKSLEDILDKLESQNTKEAKELAAIIDKIIELIIEPIEDEWLLEVLKQK